MSGVPQDAGGGDRGRLVVISGPSGVGKTTLCDEVGKRRQVARVVTCTTRAPREDETDGLDYVFLDPAEFETRAASGGFLEHANVYGNRYGTPRDQVEAGIARGDLVLLNIDVQGARQIRESGIPELTTVFIEPPDLEVLEARLRGRSTDSADAVSRRLGIARDELAEKDGYDHVVVNDEIDKAVDGILRILDRSS